MYFLFIFYKYASDCYTCSEIYRFLIYTYLSCVEYF